MKTTSTPKKFSDPVFLEIRRLRDKCGWTAGRIVRNLSSLGYTASVKQVEAIFSKRTRSHLVPDDRTTSYLEKKHENSTTGG